MKFKFKCRRSGMDIVLWHVLFVVVTACTLGVAALFYPAALAVYLIDAIEIEQVG